MQDTPSNDTIACGVPVFSRSIALKRFLESVPDYVSSVYVADNGHHNDRRHLYTTDWPYDLQVLELDYDVGIGACRRAIADTVTEPYLFMADSDMELLQTRDLKTLREILTSHDDLGAAAAWLIEPQTVRAGAHNLTFSNGTAIRHVPITPDLTTNPVPFATFDLIPQACLFRTSVFDEYTYDPDIELSEHFDFFYGHKLHTDWQWASTPVVHVLHNKNIDEQYRKTRGNDQVDLERTSEKWGVTEIVPGAFADWSDNHDRSLAEDAFDLFRRRTPPRIWVPTRRLLQQKVQ